MNRIIKIVSVVTFVVITALGIYLTIMRQSVSGLSQTKSGWMIYTNYTGPAFLIIALAFLLIYLLVIRKIKERK